MRLWLRYLLVFLVTAGIAFLGFYAEKFTALIPSPAMVSFLRSSGALIPMLNMVLLIAAAVTVACFLLTQRALSPRLLTLGALAVLTVMLGKMYSDFNVHGYLFGRREYSRFIDENFVDARAVKITPVKKRNLIVLSLESLGLVYSRKDIAGSDAIAELSRLASENTAFASYINGEFQNHTFGSLLAVNSGIYFNPGIDSKTTYSLINLSENIVNFLPKALFLPDILRQNGYQTLFVSSGKVKFTNTKVLLQNHSFAPENIFAPDSNSEDPDLRDALAEYRAVGQGWWGFSDRKALMAFRRKITKAASRGNFYAFFSGIDTHGGRFPYPYQQKFKNSVGYGILNRAAEVSRMTVEFVDWVKAQPWGADTAVVIFGDHEVMGDYFPDSKVKERRIYNVFINPPEGVSVRENRVFNQVDLCPTLLQCAGFSIEGGRIGIGTSLFSESPTFVEKFGTEFMTRELLKRSRKIDGLW